MRTIFLILLFLTLLHSATIEGDILNGDTIERMNNTLVTIEDLNKTLIAQKFFDEHYQFEIPQETYILRAYYYENGTLKYYTEHKFRLSQESMEFDLVLIPYELYGLVPGFSPPPLLKKPEPQPEIDYTPYIAVGILLFLLLAYLLYSALRPSKPSLPPEQPEEKKKRSYELDEESKQVLEILKAHEGRAIQKEIREILNYSEPKMSLIVGELEALGLVKRIKKGRVNILKLVREK